MKPSENNSIKFFNRNPIKFLAGIYVYLVVIIVYVGLIYVYNLDDISAQTIPLKLKKQTVVEDFKLQEAKEIPPVDVLELLDPSPEIIEKGKTIFDNSCASCHGNLGKGDGLAAGSLTPKPKDFTNPSGWKNGMKLTDIYKTLEEGIPGSSMSSYSYLLPDDKLALGAYIRSAFIKNPPEDTDEDLLNLDMDYELSEGSSLPAQMPVKYAAKIVVAENNSTINKVNDILSSIKNLKDSKLKDLFYYVTNNQYTAVVMLNSDKSWKNSKQLFIDLIVSDVNDNGFNGKIFQLTSDQWDGLYSLLTRQIQ